MSNLKKIILAIVVIVILVAGYLLYNTFINPLSPKDTVTLNDGDLTLEVVYSRPFKKDRLIFGTAEEKALVPYGEYWRLGANASTTFSTTKPLDFAGQQVDAGIYRMYAIPDAEHWTIVLNEAFNSFGYSEPDYTKDVLRVKIPSANLLTPIEQFTINFVQDSLSLSLKMQWDTTSVSLPLN